MSDKQVICPECEGSGKSNFVPAAVRRIEGAPPMTNEQAQQLCDYFAKCQFCEGAKTVPLERIEWRRTGEKWRQARRERSVGLREWAERVGALPSDYCNMEAGKMKPDERFNPTVTANQRP